MAVLVNRNTALQVASRSDLKAPFKPSNHSTAKTLPRRASSMFWSQVFGGFHDEPSKVSTTKVTPKPAQDTKPLQGYGHHPSLSHSRSQSQPSAFAVYVTQSGHQPVQVPLRVVYDQSKSAGTSGSAPVTVTIAPVANSHSPDSRHHNKENRYSTSHSHSRSKEFVVPPNKEYLTAHVEPAHHQRSPHHSPHSGSPSRSPDHERSHDSHAAHQSKPSQRHGHHLQAPAPVPAPSGAQSHVAVYGGSRVGSMRHSVSTPQMAQSSRAYYDTQHHYRSAEPHPIGLSTGTNHISTPSRYPQIINNAYEAVAPTGPYGVAPTSPNYAQPHTPVVQSRYVVDGSHAKTLQPSHTPAGTPIMTPSHRVRKISTSKPAHDQHHVTFSSRPPEERSIRHFSSNQHLNDLTTTPVNWPTHIHGRPRPKGYFNRRGDQFIRRGVVRRQAVPSMEWSDLFVGYPEPGMGWRDENGHWIPEGGGILKK
ncbi:hypothetical protein FRC17_000119 [Serendipita sp. 399]|nr:hypothetical protein FRC17_000119 [Serendipita sp. 399]